MSTPNDRGFALPLAIFALVTMGALVASTLLVGRVEQRIGGATIYREQAAAAAEAGLAKAVGIDPAQLEALAPYAGVPGQAAAFPISTVPGDSSVRYVDTVFRLNETLFLIQSSGQRLDADGHVLATQTLGLFARLVKPADAAVVLRPLRQRAWAQIF
jgi:hypothetical protein